MKKQIAIYKTKTGKIKVRFNPQKNTIWLNQKQISQLFETDRSSITKHINNIFKTRELFQKSNVQKMHITNSDKPVNFYNLSVIISVGYRVNSKKATKFRIWATTLLKKYITRGFVSNQKRLFQLQKTIKLISLKSKIKPLKGHESQIIDLINSYSNSFKLLKQYDDQKIKRPKLKSTTTYHLKIEDISLIIEKLKKQFPNQTFFGQQSSDKISSIIKNINQTFDQKKLYPSTEEKAANLLYMAIKDHPFIDGNKRIASALFIVFLSKNNYLTTVDNNKKINDNTLTALSLLIAISQPEEKETMISLIINLIH